METNSKVVFVNREEKTSQALRSEGPGLELARFQSAQDLLCDWEPPPSLPGSCSASTRWGLEGFLSPAHCPHGGLSFPNPAGTFSPLPTLPTLLSPPLLKAPGYLSFLCQEPNQKPRSPQSAYHLHQAISSVSRNE